MTENSPAVSASRFVQVIDLHTGHPAEVERLLNAWRRTALRREHVECATIGRDDRDEGHLVLRLEYPSADAAASAPEADPAGDPDAGAPGLAEAIAVVGLLDRPPQFHDVEMD
jgi:hypothetical protein